MLNSLVIGFRHHGKIIVKEEEYSIDSQYLFRRFNRVVLKRSEFAILASKDGSTQKKGAYKGITVRPILS